MQVDAGGVIKAASPAVSSAISALQE